MTENKRKDQGLTTVEAKKRQEQFGKNELVHTKKQSFLEKR